VPCIDVTDMLQEVLEKSCSHR